MLSLKIYSFSLVNENEILIGYILKYSVGDDNMIWKWDINGDAVSFYSSIHP